MRTIRLRISKVCGYARQRLVSCGLAPSQLKVQSSPMSNHAAVSYDIAGAFKKQHAEMLLQEIKLTLGIDLSEGKYHGLLAS